MILVPGRWGCEEQVRCKDIVIFYNLAWLVKVVHTMILVLGVVDGNVKSKLDAKV